MEGYLELDGVAVAGLHDEAKQDLDKEVTGNDAVSESVLQESLIWRIEIHRRETNGHGDDLVEPGASDGVLENALDVQEHQHDLVEIDRHVVAEGQSIRGAWK